MTEGTRSAVGRGDDGGLRAKRVWCVLDRKAGHRSMTRGMVDALATVVDLEVNTVELAGWMIPLGKALQGAWPLGAGILRRGGLQGDCPEPGAPPDLVLGSGGNVLWGTAALARLWGCPSVFVGSRRRLPADAMTVFVHYDPDRDAEEFLRLAVLPGPRPKGDPRELWRGFCTENGLDSGDGYLACLVGGDGGGYTWQHEDAMLLGRLLREACVAAGQRLLITTSRRTAPEVEAALREELPDAVIADACWFADGDARRVVAPYLAGANRVVVTEDSMSMVHEAVASGKPLVTVSPRAVAPNRSTRDYLANAAAEGWLARVPVDGSTDLAAAFATAKGFHEDVWEHAGKALATRLGWID